MSAPVDGPGTGPTRRRFPAPGAPIDRRRFLALGGATALAATLVACGGRSGPPVELGAIPEVFPDREGMARIGRLAVDVVGDDPHALARRIAPPGVGAAWLATATAAELRARLARAVPGDFRAGRVVDVGGWRLARTEADVAALVHLAR